MPTTLRAAAVEDRLEPQFAELPTLSVLRGQWLNRVDRIQPSVRRSFAHFAPLGRSTTELTTTTIPCGAILASQVLTISASGASVRVFGVRKVLDKVVELVHKFHRGDVILPVRSLWKLVKHSFLSIRLYPTVPAGPIYAHPALLADLALHPPSRLHPDTRLVLFHDSPEASTSKQPRSHPSRTWRSTPDNAGPSCSGTSRPPPLYCTSDKAMSRVAFILQPKEPHLLILAAHDVLKRLMLQERPSVLLHVHRPLEQVRVILLQLHELRRRH